MIKLLSLKLSAWFRALSHVIYLYLFLLWKGINNKMYDLRQSGYGNHFWNHQMELNQILTAKEWIRILAWDFGEERGLQVRLRWSPTPATLGGWGWQQPLADPSGPGSCRDLAAQRVPVPACPAGLHSLRDIPCQREQLPPAHSVPWHCRRGQGLWFMRAQGLLGGFLSLWWQTAQAQSYGTFKQPGHLVTGIYLSKSVTGQCLNNSVCILVPILFHLHFWSQPEKERQFPV